MLVSHPNAHPEADDHHPPSILPVAGLQLLASEPRSRIHFVELADDASNERSPADERQPAIALSIDALVLQSLNGFPALPGSA